MGITHITLNLLLRNKSFATESTTIMSIAPERTIVSVISNA